MPISKSANKALRNAEAKNKINASLKNKLAQTIKKTTTATLNEAFSIIDKSAKRHLIHKNKAARLKSRLAKNINNEKTVVKKTAAKKKSSKKVSKKK